MNRLATSHSKGVEAEKIAADYLRRKGYKILHERYKTRGGEIDIVVQKQGVIAFVEVKARAHEEEALYAVTPRTQARIIKAAQYFIAETLGHDDCEMRFDVITIVTNQGTTSPFTINHLDNAWQLPA